MYVSKFSHTDLKIIFCLRNIIKFKQQKLFHNYLKPKHCLRRSPLQFRHASNFICRCGSIEHKYPFACCC